MTRFLLVFFCTLTCFFSSAAVAQQRANVNTADFIAYVDGVARGQMEVHATPGIATVIVTPDGALARVYGVGATSAGEPIELDADRSMFPIASISKTFVAVALMRAVEQGLIDLDAPANQYLDFALPSYRGARAITVRDIARHEAGFEERWLATGAGGQSPDPRPWGQILAETQPRLIAAPGTYASYSNYGAALLGYIVERASGRPYYQFLQEEIFSPLGMTSSGIESPAPDALAPFADRIVYGWRSSGRVIRPGSYFANVRTYPAGRMMLSLSDAATYMRMLLSRGLAADGARFLSAGSVDELLTPQHRVHPAMTGVGVLFAEKDIGGRRFVGHGGDGDTHHTDLILSPQEGVGVFVVFLAAPGPEARDYFTRTVLERLLPRPDGGSATTASTSAQQDLSAYAGSYRHYRWAFTSIEKVLQLSSEFAVRDSGAGTLIVTGRLSAGEFAATENDGLFRNTRTDELLYFHRGADGRMNLNHGNFPFVTAFQLREEETQDFNVMAYWTFIIGLSLLGIAVLATAARAALGGGRIRALGFGLLALASISCGVGLWVFMTTAMSMSEQEVQLRIPDIAYWLLAIPMAAAAIAAIFLVLVVAGPFRPRAFLEQATTALTLAGLSLFFVYLHQWNAFGWNVP